MYGSFGIGPTAPPPPGSEVVAGSHCPTECAGAPEPTECKQDCYCRAVCLIDPETEGPRPLEPACFKDCVESFAVPSTPAGASIVQLGRQLPNGQQCVQQNGEVYCLSRESHLKKNKYLYFGVGVAAGLTIGALVGYMVR